MIFKGFPSSGRALFFMVCHQFDANWKRKGGIAQHSNQFDQTENGDYVAKLMKFLNSSSSFNVYNFKQLLSDIQLESVSTQSSKKQNINVQKQSSNISSQTQKAEPIVNRTDVNSVQQPKVNSIQKEPVVRQNIPDNRISVPPVQPPVSSMKVKQVAIKSSSFFQRWYEMRYYVVETVQI